MSVAIDVAQLLTDCRAAQDRMSNKNPHKHVLLRMELALMVLLRERVAWRQAAKDADCDVAEELSPNDNCQARSDHPDQCDQASVPATDAAPYQRERLGKIAASARIR